MAARPEHRLIELRELMNIKQVDMAKLLKILPQSMGQYEKGQRPLPIVVVRQLLQFYPWLDARWLLGLD